MSENIRPFVFKDSEYERDGDPLIAWVKAQTDHICNLYGYDRTYVEKWVKDSIKQDGASPFYDRKVQYIHQTSPGNRELKVGSFYQYLKTARQEGYVLSPSQSAYRDPVKHPSITAKFTQQKAAQRSVYKKRGQDFKVKGFEKEAGDYDTLQKNEKELNNSYSGANSSWFNALCNASGHQALTSTCRSATSYANITVEKFLMGNRVYVEPQIVLQELSNAMMLADHDAIMTQVRKFGLKIPTYKDVYNCAAKSYTKYFRSNKWQKEFKLFISTMHDAARCAFVYLGDLYHLDQLNPKFIDDLFVELDAYTVKNTEDVGDYYNNSSSDVKTLVFSLLKDMTRGKLYKDFDTEGKNIINNVAKSYTHFFEKYEDFIKAIWRPNYLPSGMAYLRTMLREAILTSDTDSAIGTTQYWTKRITGSYNFNPTSFMVCFNAIFFTSESVANAFGKMCANMGVPEELISKLGAKNEYYFSMYTLTEAMKHYFARKELEEGRVLPEPELEKKGVGFISARFAKKIADELDEWIEHDVMDNVKENVSLTKDQILGRPIALEKETREIIRSGKIIYQTDTIRSLESYKAGAENATYRQHSLWNRVFGPTYGKMDEPPYSVYKVPVALSKRRHMQAWADRLEDKAMAARLRLWLEETGVEQMASILVPMPIADANGIPKEIVQVVDEPRATAQIMSPFYLGLGGLGFMYNNSTKNKLITDGLFTD